jgi:hypothetical protein
LVKFIRVSNLIAYPFLFINQKITMLKFLCNDNKLNLFYIFKDSLLIKLLYMKKNYFLTLLLTLCISVISYAQTTLAAGDLVVVDLHADTPDSFRFVPLVDLESGTVIKFTENAWDGTALRTNESTITFTADAAISKGTNIQFEAGTSDSRFAVTGSLGFSTSGDQVIVYQGDSASPTFIFAVQSNSTQWQTAPVTDTNQSALPTGLTDGVNAVAAGAGAGAEDEHDNVYYTGITTGTSTEILAAVASVSNWAGSNSTGYTAKTGNFTINATAQPSLNISSPTEGSTIDYVATATVKFTVGNFNVAAGGTGDGYIKWKLDDVAQTDKTDTSDITFAATAGTTYKVYIELVDNSGNPLGTPVNATVNFTVNHPCDLELGAISTTCDALTSGTDTYSGTIAFTGGNTGATYTITAPAGVVVGGDNPNTTASGTITFTNITEGVDAAINIAGGATSSCDFDRTLYSPTCVAFPVVETFNYTVGQNLGDQPLWTNSNSGDEILIATPTIANPFSTAQFADPTGNMVSFDGSGKDPYIEFNQQNSGTVYASFIFTATDISGLTNGNGGYFAVLTQASGSYKPRLWLRQDTGDNTKYNVGITAGSSGATYHTLMHTPGEEIFIVMAYDFATNDVKVWIDPDPASFGGGSVPTETLKVTASGNDIPTDLGRFLIRQDSGTETPSINFDELRISTSWADVTPKGAAASVEKNNIEGFTTYPNPVNNGRLTIITSSASEKEVTIFNVLGKRVYSQKFTGTNKQLDVSQIKSGIYIMKVIEDEKVATKKLVIK